MYNIITKQDFFTLVYLYGTPKNEFSPVPALKDMKLDEDSIEESKRALEKIGFFKDGDFTGKGRFITGALMSPEYVVITANTALIDHAPVSYCYKDGFWTVLAADIKTGFITIVSPVFVKDIKLFARQNLMYDLKIGPYEPFLLELADTELLLFELTQLVIINRFKEKKRGLEKEESRFAADELFEGDTAFYMTTGSDYLYPKQRASLSSMLSDPAAVKNALAGLVKKGLIEMSGSKLDISFLHSHTAHKWLMADVLLDKIAIRSVPYGKAYSYRITQSGILKVSEIGGKIRFNSVPDIELEFFDTPKVRSVAG